MRPAVRSNSLLFKSGSNSMFDSDFAAFSPIAFMLSAVLCMAFISFSEPFSNPDGSSPVGITMLPSSFVGISSHLQASS